MQPVVLQSTTRLKFFTHCAFHPLADGHGPWPAVATRTLRDRTT
ncbi:hypothetical protein SXCC_04006 [Gluconacetobacter sp. SXCC-1]|nr:hypothetical protein SXCC_04006 [Gluconacetobacter sp. SXCC-1]